MFQRATTLCARIFHSGQSLRRGTGPDEHRARKMALRRKRSLSVADLPVQRNDRCASTGQQTGPMSNQKSTTTRKQKSDESGYDSDVTRKSSPRGSLKNGETSSNKTEDYDTNSSSRSREDTDSMSSGSEDSGAQVKQNIGK